MAQGGMACPQYQKKNFSQKYINFHGILTEELTGKPPGTAPDRVHTN